MNLLLFSLMSRPTELYLSRESKSKALQTSQIASLSSRTSNNSDKELYNKSIKDKTIDNEIEDAIEQINTSEDIVETPLKKDKNEDFMSKIVRYGAQAKETFREIKSTFKNIYESIVGYVKSKYIREEEQERKIDKDCWQIGIDFSRTCNFIFFPKKPKRITGILIDKGILLDYVNPAPALCYF